MKQYFIVFLSVFLISFSGQAQENVKHIVAKGETITQIAQKYNVTPLDIYTLNPDARNGVKEKTVLLIPSKNKIVKIPNKETKSTVVATRETKSHVVLPKETPYGLAKQYGITLADLENANPEIKEVGLKIGQTLVIPGSKNGKVEAPKEVTKKEERKAEREEKKAEKEAKKEDKAEVKTAETNLVYEVVPKDTKYSISKRYGISIEELEKTNPSIKTDSLKIGQKLVIKSSTAKADPVQKQETAKETPKQETPNGDYTTYLVKPKETLYSLSRQFGLSQNGLVALNPELETGVREGMTLKVPKTVAIASSSDKNFTDLTKSISKKDRKELVLLLPFNVSKITNDTTSNIQTRLKKDNFLNMTLDFYSGALVAIDSAKTLGLNIDVKIFDSQENKASSAISSAFVESNLSKADVVVGPFYQSHAEKTAQFLNQRNIPVISPLSKDNSMVYSNLYQTMPTSETLKGAMFDYLNQKNANLIAIVDPKKGSIKKYISSNHPNVKMADYTVESMKGLLAKDRMNYVIMETENTFMIKNIITALVSAKASYQVQLVILEPNDKLESDEISISNLAKLNLLYASVTRENETPEAAIFSKVYKKKNNIFPNQYATRGFDVTFDAMLRLSQEKSFEETIFDNATEQVENKFNYTKNPAGGYSNRGVYILYYDESLSVKEAK
ncbi:amino acid ABC transporter substrate-binding protein [Flavobacterium macacae]|uniref:LysM peptidoglycan-binding domain-containing protein n=1 Tax=Flavobacterium macacae TaxID=2488993 RepID=A0A3P3WF51_9FLAO|nr:LysM peptidoglycan-binding domain-containing protein [Flavobacterium macacae]RRJ93007.1 LysM peptidoglycan-binding domain-containing protein [Flavobacterium macacae]